MDANELLLKADWLRETMYRDGDVKAGFLAALTTRHYESMNEFVDDDPDGFIAVVDALMEMTAQIPLEQTWSAGEGKHE